MPISIGFECLSTLKYLGFFSNIHGNEIPYEGYGHETSLTNEHSNSLSSIATQTGRKNDLALMKRCSW